MKIAEKLGKMTGTLKFSIVEAATGMLISEHTVKNLITDNGYHAAAQALAGVPGVGIKSISVGDSTVPPALSDTMIQSAVNVPISSVEYPDNASVRFNFRISSGTANGLNITEFGLFTQDGRMFSRLVRPEVISKTSGIEVIGGWVINI